MPSTSPQAVLIDLTVSQLAELWEAQNGVGDYWWLSVLKALTGGGSSDGAASASQPKPQNVRWL